jgi:hypothetical protein
MNNNQNQNNQLKNLKGSNNGTWGFGMYGALYSASMNGPFGNRGLPLPNDNVSSTMTVNPAYNSKLGNFPKYNEKQFVELSGYDLGTNFGSYCN